MRVSFWQLISQTWHFEHCFSGFKLSKEFLMHLALSLNNLVTKVDLALCILSVPGVMKLGRIYLGLHILVELMFLFPDKFPLHVYYLLQFFDLPSLLFDPVGINLCQVKVEGGYIIHCCTILI